MSSYFGDIDTMSTASDSVFGGANGLLEVYISRARDLPNLRKLDKQSPFVRLRLAHMTETSDVVSRGGQTPRFNFYTKFDLTPDVKPLLLIELFDDKSPPRLIGQCEVDLTPALYKDPEDGHDDWYQLYHGSEEAGQIYMELTFHPVVPTARAHHMDDENNEFEASLASRPPPPLPSNVPTVQLKNFMSKSDDTDRRAGNRYLHASRVQQHIPSIGQGASLRESSAPPMPPFNFSSSINSNATGDSQITHNSQSSHSTINTTGTTEPLFAKLKQLKEKWRSIKNPNPEQLGQENKVDLKALQKVVGVAIDDTEDNNDMRTSSRISMESSKFISQPPLPELPKQCSRKSSFENSPTRLSPATHGRLNSHMPQLSPRLPPLPSSPSFTRKTSSPSPTRRRPPPLH